MDFNLNHLRTFLAIAHSGSFMAAAAAMGRTQSAISLHIQELEQRLGVELFDRSFKPARITATGEAVLREAEKVLDGAARIDALSSTVSEAGSVMIGAIPSTIPWLIAPAIARFKRRFPAVSVHLKSDNSRELLEMWQLGSVDAAVMVEPIDTGANANFVPFHTEPYVLITPISNTMSDPDRILRRFPYIWFDRSTWSSDPVRQLISSSTFNPKVEIECDTLEGVVAMVANGLGVSIVPILTGHAPYSSSVGVFELRGRVEPRAIGLLVSRRPTQTRYLEELQGILLELGRDARAPL